MNSLQTECNENNCGNTQKKINIFSPEVKFHENYSDNSKRGKDFENIGTKCGEIFTIENKIYNFLCTFCGTLFKDIITFTEHITIYHINQCKNQHQLHDSLDEPEIKIEPNDETINYIRSEELITTTEIHNFINVQELEQITQNSSLSQLPNKTENLDTDEIKHDIFKDLTENPNNEPLPLPIILESQVINNKKLKIPKEKKNSNSKIKNIKKSSTTFFCDLCDMKFDREIVLKSHKMYDHNPTYQDVEMNKEESIKKSIDSIKNDPLKCRYCDRRFKRRAKRFEHECSHTGEKPYSCDICKKTFREKHPFTVHLREHKSNNNDKIFECHICSSKFKTTSNLRVHIRRHNNDRPHKCNYCDKSFINNAIKKIHESIHTGERRYQCAQCGEGFYKSSHLTVHVRRHNGEKSYKCDYCDKMFITKGEKRDHERVHTKEKPFVCDICNAAFQRSNGLRQHKKIHSDVFGYKCHICGKGFKQFSGLYCHKKSHGEVIGQSQKS